MALVELLFLFLATVCCLTLIILRSDPRENENGVGPPDDEDRRSRWTRIRESRRSRAAAAASALDAEPFLSKELIMAMAQMNVYRLVDRRAGGSGVDEPDEVNEWARNFVTNSCSKLDEFSPDVLALEAIVNGFCNEVEKLLDTKQVIWCIAHRRVLGNEGQSMGEIRVGLGGLSPPPDIFTVYDFPTCLRY